MALSQPLPLSSGQRAELQGYLRKHNLPAGVAQRMRIILRLADGGTYREICAALATTALNLDRRSTHQRGVRSVLGRSGGHRSARSTPAHHSRHLNVHKAPRVREFLDRHVHFHFTPTYSSWLNQVETWFSKLQRDVIDRGIFTSVADLRRKILRYIRLYAKTAKPFRWKYSDIRHRIRSW